LLGLPRLAGSLRYDLRQVQIFFETGSVPAKTRT
jgi:hypothetical protein